MKIKENFRAFKDAPVQATKIAIIALLVAITALLLSIGKRA